MAETIGRLPELRDALTEFAEIGLDAAVDNPLIGRLPIVGLVRDVWSGGRRLQDTLLERKLASFLAGVAAGEDIGDASRWRAKLEGPDAQDTSERILTVVEAAASRLKATYVGWVARRFLDGACDRPTLHRTIEMIGLALTEDLTTLIAALQPDSSGATTAAIVFEPGPEARLGAIGFITPPMRSQIQVPHQASTISAEARLLRCPH